MVWSKEQIACLEQNFPTLPDAELARVIGKSPNALRIKASRLGINKEMTSIRRELELTPIERQVIIGGLLGDLSCRISRTSIYARLEGGHCERQKEYMLWKINLLQRLMFNVGRAATGAYLYQSRNFKALNEYYHLFYSKECKSINREILDLLGDFGLLIWYLDDGTYHKRDRNIRLHTNGFTFEEQLIIKKWFKEKYNVEPSVYKNTDNKRYPNKNWYYLYFKVKDSEKLLGLFRKFPVPNCMKYKLGNTDITLHYLNETGIEYSQSISG